MLLAFEGIDGAGKTTQVRLLAERARLQGLRTAVISFPRYRETVFGQCVAAYLRGEFGPLERVPPRSAALLFAGDRLESLELLTRLAAEHDLLILDRYVASNLAHQGARFAGEERSLFLTWLAQLEYTAFGLPRAAMTLCLDLPVSVAARLIAERGHRQGGGSSADIHEADLAYLARCREVYQELAHTGRDSLWEIISCVNERGELRPPEEIHQQIWRLLEERRP
jgi:dTMP kinase